MLLAQKKVQLHLYFKWPAVVPFETTLGSLKSRASPKIRKSRGKKKELRGCLLILKQACSPEYQRAQYAFKDSMIHWILQFTLRIAFRCVLHRCESQEIRCWKLYFELSWQFIIFFRQIILKKSWCNIIKPCQIIKKIIWRDLKYIAHKVDMDF